MIEYQLYKRKNYSYNKYDSICVCMIVYEMSLYSLPVYASVCIVTVCASVCIVTVCASVCIVTVYVM